MRKISDTIARLAALKARHAASSSATSARPIVSGTYRISAPTQAHCKRNSIFLMTCRKVRRSSWYSMAARRARQGTTIIQAGRQLADEGRLRAALSRAAASNNPNLCFNWFQPNDIRRDAGEALSIRQMIEAMVKTHRLDRNASSSRASLPAAPWPRPCWHLSRCFRRWRNYRGLAVSAAPRRSRKRLTACGAMAAPRTRICGGMLRDASASSGAMAQDLDLAGDRATKPSLLPMPRRSPASGGASTRSTARQLIPTPRARMHDSPGAMPADRSS